MVNVCNGTRYSNELQWIGFMRRHQDNSPINGSLCDTPVVIIHWNQRDKYCKFSSLLKSNVKYNLADVYIFKGLPQNLWCDRLPIFNNVCRYIYTECWRQSYKLLFLSLHLLKLCWFVIGLTYIWLLSQCCSMPWGTLAWVRSYRVENMRCFVILSALIKLKQTLHAIKYIFSVSTHKYISVH